MLKPYIDLHTHSTLSDGALPPQQLVDKARAAGIQVLALTDHNFTQSLSTLRMNNSDMRLIQGVEASCLYIREDGEEVEIHVVGLGFDPNDEKMQAVLHHNQPDRRPYITAVLDKLRSRGINLGRYEELCAAHPDIRCLGRMQIAKTMKEQGFVFSVEEAFDRYIGAFGERLAYVPNPLKYVSMEEAVEAIRSAGGIAVLAHPLSYRLSAEENVCLVQQFKGLASADAALEVFYSHYNPAQWSMLMDLADKYSLLYSAASDFHGQAENDRIDNCFSHVLCTEILSRLGIHIDDHHL